ncbi:hypothetical protein GQ53DRAFT_369710 [Thozetella sp. PMI_491]|nr:hypothetical protein GQ53DRAFT_369710 [Thozetella sp. PMI_491]
MLIGDGRVEGHASEGWGREEEKVGGGRVPRWLQRPESLPAVRSCSCWSKHPVGEMGRWDGYWCGWYGCTEYYPQDPRTGELQGVPVGRQVGEGVATEVALGLGPYRGGWRRSQLIFQNHARLDVPKTALNLRQAGIQTQHTPLHTPPGATTTDRVILAGSCLSCSLEPLRRSGAGLGLGPCASFGPGLRCYQYDRDQTATYPRPVRVQPTTGTRGPDQVRKERSLALSAFWRT